MFRKLVYSASVIFVLGLFPGTVFGADILAPGDFIIAIDADGNSGSPAAEPVEEAIDGITAGGGAKYLNSGRENSGFIVTPQFGSSIVTSFQIWTANDVEARDPASWELYGTNDPIVSVHHGDGMGGENWTLIASGSLSLPSERNVLGPLVTFANSTSYKSYKMIFPTVKDAASTTQMQIAEIQFFGVGKNAGLRDPKNGIIVAPQVQDPNSNLFMMLSFTAGDGAITHTAYFGTDAADVLSRNPANSIESPPWPGHLPTTYYVGYDAPEVPQFARASLVRSVTYYWAVDEYDGTKTWPGDLWSFTVMPEEAWDPTPADGANFVATEPDLTLSWKLGDLVVKNYDVSYLVYWGTDEAAVEAATTGGIPVPDEATSTNVTGLPAGTEVFWRVDTERTLAAYPFTIYETKGVVWSFTTLPVATITDPDMVGWWKLDGKYGDIVFDYSGYANHGALIGDPQWVANGKVGGALAFDGVDDMVVVEQNSGLPIYNNGTDNAYSVAMWVKGGPQPDRRVFSEGSTSNNTPLFNLGTQNGGATGQFDVYIRPNTGTTLNHPHSAAEPFDQTWHHIAWVDDNGTARLYVDGQLDGGDFNYTRGTMALNTTSIGGILRAAPSYFFTGQIDDVRVFKRTLSAKETKILSGLVGAANPDPPNGATGASKTPTLSWQAGAFMADSDGNILYFADDMDQVSDRTVAGTPLTNTSYLVPGTLDLGQTYYWAVDTVNGVERWPGDLWSFTVVDYLLVDDMDTYTEWRVADNNIFEVWVDGMGNCKGSGNGTGANVFESPGNGVDGSQAMQFSYDNDGTVVNPCLEPPEEQTRDHYYSKAEAEVGNLPSGIGSNWTIGGVKALSLMFYGNIGNAIEPMWVKLTDTSDNSFKVTYGVNPGEAETDLEDMLCRGTNGTSPWPTSPAWMLPT